jgi:hypothetical protein
MAPRPSLAASTERAATARSKAATRSAHAACAADVIPAVIPIVIPIVIPTVIPAVIPAEAKIVPANRLHRILEKDILRSPRAGPLRDRSNATVDAGI